MIKTDVRWRRALYDTITHGCIAFLSWAVVSNALHESPAFVSALLCGILAMVLDGDHFYEARSFQLEKALSLQHRPFMHSTSTVIVISLNVWVLVKFMRSYWNVSCLDYLPWMCLIAWISHHLRDANRRGMWFMPLGSTPPLPQWMYISLILLFVWLVTVVLYYRSSTSVVNVTYLGSTSVNVQNSHIIEL
ncbi:hypothetical protein LSH36_358g02091 [Paralvinella palmiformis]|uniref:Transmembrane protein 267 n=1 Tax=Paralvinella palmiformis TaxID=53620 RepID=A0AAD9MZW2_9ANNE|nr:hypothetical protein LSH36_358g02091 [Paralvinella palmiformis]